MLKIDLNNYKNLKVISFDIFDTAIIRETFRPKDIFDIIEAKYGNNFKESRMLAEKTAREKQGGECGLDSIYNELGENFTEFKYILDEIKQMEVALEINHSQPNKDILDFYNSVKDHYKIVFTSDMYLPLQIINTLLKNAGYQQHSVYLSGKIGLNKSEGKLFDYLLCDLGIKPEELLHIGDNYASDIVSAQKKGINTYYFINNYDKSHSNKDIADKNIVKLYNHKDFSTSFLTRLLSQKENSSADVYNKIGYYWGIIFYNFTKWVIDEANDRRILFNSRDGYIPHKICQEIMGKNSEYIYISRRSSALIAFNTSYPINHNKNLYFYNTFRFQRVNNIKQLFSCIGLNSQKVLTKIKKAGFTCDEDNIEPFKFNSQEIHEKLESLLISVQSEIYEHCSSKKQAFIDYLDKLDLNNNDIFCDIGYNGSIQYCIELLTDIKLDGKYFEVYKRSIELDCKKQGYLSNGENLTYGYGGLLESIFSAPHGGVIGYDDCSPLFFKDSNKRINILNKVHAGILEFCKDWHKLTKKQDLIIDKDIIKFMVLRFLKEPTLEESKYGLDVPFDNGAEDSLENITWFNEDRIKKGRIKECYSRSYWKEAFLKMLDESEYAGLARFL